MIAVIESPNRLFALGCAHLFDMMDRSQSCTQFHARFNVFFKLAESGRAVMILTSMFRHLRLPFNSVVSAEASF